MWTKWFNSTNYFSPPRQDDLRAVFRACFSKIIENYNVANGIYFIPQTLLMTDAEFKMDYDVQIGTKEIIILSIKGTSNKKVVYLDLQLYFPSIFLNLLSMFSLFP